VLRLDIDRRPIAWTGGGPHLIDRGGALALQDRYRAYGEAERVRKDAGLRDPLCRRRGLRGTNQDADAAGLARQPQDPLEIVALSAVTCRYLARSTMIAGEIALRVLPGPTSDEVGALAFEPILELPKKRQYGVGSARQPSLRDAMRAGHASVDPPLRQQWHFTKLGNIERSGTSSAAPASCRRYTAVSISRMSTLRNYDPSRRVMINGTPLDGYRTRRHPMRMERPLSA